MFASLATLARYQSREISIEHSVKEKAKYIVCQNGRSKSSLICQNPVRSVIAIYKPQKVVILCERRKKKNEKERGEEKEEEIRKIK